MTTYGVLVFETTHLAMLAEKQVKEQKIAARIIPTPEKIKASCGFALKYQLEDEKELLSLLTKQDIAIEGCYHAQGLGLKMNYTVVMEE